jgi:DNA gyrase subunit A
MSILFSEKDTRAMGRATAGVIGIRLKGNDETVSAEIALEKSDLLVVTEKGFGKRSHLSSWPIQGRAGIGVRAAEVTDRNGFVVAAEVIEKNHENLIITTKAGQVIKLPIRDVPVLTRQTQGVILIRLGEEGDSVAAATVTTKERRERVVKEKVVF